MHTRSSPSICVLNSFHYFTCLSYHQWDLTPFLLSKTPPHRYVLLNLILRRRGTLIPSPRVLPSGRSCPSLPPFPHLRGSHTSCERSAPIPFLESLVSRGHSLLRLHPLTPPTSPTPPRLILNYVSLNFF